METTSFSDAAKAEGDWEVEERMLLLVLLLSSSEAGTGMVNAGPFETDLFLHRVGSSDKQPAKVNRDSTATL